MTSMHYELAVEGAVGPVLRCALLPRQASPTESSTVLRLHGSEQDITELVRTIESLGLELVSVRAVD